LFSTSCEVYGFSSIESIKITLPEEVFSSTMGTWTFLDYLSTRGVNEIHAWLNSKDVPKLAKAKINARIAALRGFPIFPEQYFSSYKGWDELYELRVGFSGVEYRPIGFYGPERKQFCLLIGGIEKGKLPRSLLDAAEERRKLVIASPSSRTCPHDFS
jgi:hypothetical protein